MKTCKEVAILLIAREDHPLSLGERMALRIHLMVCRACPRFEQQLLTMRQAMKTWRHYVEQE
jgi:hypothetical protein